jgi:Na+/glutamate symporter
MATHSLPIRHTSPRTDELHPRIYSAVVGLTIWLVLSVWLLFSRGSYEGLTLAVITLFFTVLVGIPILLWLTWRHNAAPHEQSDGSPPFDEWSSKTFETWTGDLSGRHALIQILLPIAAVAIGMTVFGLVFMLAVPTLS